MGCGASRSVPNTDEIDLIHRICILIENKNPTAETVWELLKDLPNRDRKLWKDCWSTPLVSAVKENRKDLVSFLVDDADFDIDALGQHLVEDWCALGTAIDRQNLRMATFLVFTKGANPNLKWKKFPYTLIAQAMPYQYEPDQSLIRFLVNDLGCDVNLTFTSSWKGSRPISPLCHAIQMDFYWDNSDWDLTRLILELGGDPNFETFCQWNAEEKRLEFGEGILAGKIPNLLQSQLKKIKFEPDKYIQQQNVQKLIKMLEEEVL